MCLCVMFQSRDAIEAFRAFHRINCYAANEDDNARYSIT